MRLQLTVWMGIVKSKNKMNLITNTLLQFINLFGSHSISSEHVRHVVPDCIAGPGYAIQAPPVLDWPNSFRAEYVYLNISGDVVN